LFYIAHVLNQDGINNIKQVIQIGR